MTIQGTNFYSVEETAKILGISKKTLYNWKGKAESYDSKPQTALHPVTAPNGRKYFREADIIAVLSQCWGVEVTPATLSSSRDLIPT